MTHWISLLATANGQEEHESQEVAGLKRRLAAVEKALGRSSKAQKTAPHQGSAEQSGRGSKGKQAGEGEGATRQQTKTAKLHQRRCLEAHSGNSL